MNFISVMEQEEVAVELKYCERCGGLWLRLRGADGVYCPGCHARMKALPRAKARRGTERHSPQGEDLGIQVQIESLLGVAEVEVRA